MAKLNHTPELVEECIKAYTVENKPLKFVANKLGCSIPTASKILKNNNVKIRGRGSKSTDIEMTPEEIKAKREQIIKESSELGLDGETQPEISNEEFENFKKKIIGT